jgi:hypothetical protein
MKGFMERLYLSMKDKHEIKQTQKQLSMKGFMKPFIISMETLT